MQSNQMMRAFVNPISQKGFKTANKKAFDRTRTAISIGCQQIANVSRTSFTIEYDLMTC